MDTSPKGLSIFFFFFLSRSKEQLTISKSNLPRRPNASSQMAI